MTAKDVFGAFDVREDDLLLLPDDADFADLGFSGFADGTVQRLRSKISEGGAEGATPTEATHARRIGYNERRPNDSLGDMTRMNIVKTTPETLL